MNVFYSDFDVIVFTVAFAFWCLSLLLERLIIKKEGKTAIKTKEDRGTYYLIYLCVLFSIIISEKLGFDGNIRLPDFTFYIGVIILLSGTLLRGISVFMLGKYFTYQVSVMDNQSLIKSGPYQYIRHPGYAGLIGSLIGISLAFRSMSALVIVGIMCFFAFGLRIKFVEEMLSQELGNDYTQYKNKTKRLIPFIY